MKYPSQAKVSATSFIIALVCAAIVFAIMAYFAIGAIFSEDAPEDPSTVVVDPDNKDPEQIDPSNPSDEKEEIDGESFSVLIAGYDLKGEGFDAMVVIDVNKEDKKVTVYPINVDTKVYVGHGDANSSTGSTLNISMGSLIKYKDIAYVLDKLNAVTGLKVKYYATLTAEGFIKAFDEFNKNAGYSYKVPKDMEHVYHTVEALPEGSETDTETVETGDEQYNISFKKGDVISSGIDIYNMLRYKGDSASDRSSRQTAFVKDVIQKMVPATFKETNLTKIVNTAKGVAALKESVTTNVSVESFITETFDLIAKMPSFTYATSTKFTTTITNYK